MKLLKDLISTPEGKVSHTKFWGNIGYLAGTIMILTVTYRDKLTWDLFLIYLATVGGSAQASKLIGLKYGATPAKEEAPA
mgnify:CR=1 FL=1